MRHHVIVPAVSAIILCAAVPAVHAQAWNDRRVTELVSRATELRASQMSDSLLRDYSAEASGALSFQGQLGRIPALPVKVTQIRSRLFWQSPGRSKQIIIGLRDTTLLPAEITYYPERYGIIQNNFPDVIRLGDGRDVADTPHPLSRQGLQEYDFAITDSLAITLPGQRIDVYQVNVRPRNDALPRVIGRLYLARESAAVVRMVLTFTRAAMLDKRNEQLTVTLENALIESRFWLPWRQELYLSRTGVALDFPARGIIRAHWQLCCYTVNISVPASTFSGPEIISSSPAVLREYQWNEDILEALPPDVRVLTPQQVLSLRAEAEQMVRARALSPRRGGAIAGSRVSDFVRANRVEGVALGLGGALRSGNGASFRLNGRYGLSDHDLKGRAAIILQKPSGAALRFYAEREHRDVSIVQERSLALNTLTAPLLGSDYTDTYDARAAGVVLETSALSELRPRFELSYQRHGAVGVNMDPLRGSFRGTIPAAATHHLAFDFSLAGGATSAPLGVQFQWNFDSELALFNDRGEGLKLNGPRYARLGGRFSAERPYGTARLVVGAAAGATFAESAPALSQKLQYLGGPVSAPGYEYHELAGEMGAFVRAELRLPVPFFSISLGKYGRSPASATIAPNAGTAYISGPPTLSRRRSGFYPSVGIGSALLFDLMRFDVARGLRDGRWTFTFDIARDFWDIL